MQSAQWILELKTAYAVVSNISYNENVELPEMKSVKDFPVN